MKLIKLIKKLFTTPIFQKRKMRIGLSILDLTYIRGVKTREQMKEYLRRFANQGFTFIRFFNSDRDVMKYKDYTPEFWKRVREILQFFFCEKTGKQMFIPVLDVTAYSRLSLNNLSYKQWKEISGIVAEIYNEIFGDRWIMSDGNEMKAAPNNFDYDPAKGGLPGVMERFGAWVNDFTKHFMSLKICDDNYHINVCDDELYPDKGHPQTSDMGIGKTGTNIGAGGATGVKKVIAGYHRIHKPSDLRKATTAPGGKSRILDSIRTLWKIICDNDGNAADDVLSDGVDPSPQHKGTYKSPSPMQLFETTKYLSELTKYGIPRGSKKYYATLWMADLFREHVSHNLWYTCLECKKVTKFYKICHEERPTTCDCGGKLKFKRSQYITDWNYIDFDRSELMAQGVLKVYGKSGLPNRGKFPPIEKEIIIAKPIEETKEIIIQKEAIMPKLTFKEKIKKFWNGNKKKPLFWFHVTAYSLSFWKVLEIIFW